MARARILKMGFFENEVLAQLPDKARLLYAGLWLIADRSGRLEDRPARIRAQIFPYEPVDCEALLTALASSGFIRRYASEGMKVIDLPSFLVHQSPHHREPDSKLPAFSQSLGSAEAKPDLAPVEPQPSPTDPVSDPVLVLVSDPVTVKKPRAKRADPVPLEGFDEFWLAYPLKVAKEDAIKAWNEIAPNAALREFIGAALIWQRPNLTFEKDGQIKGKYPAAWLRGKRWTDERPPVPSRVASSPMRLQTPGQQQQDEIHRLLRAAKESA